MKMTLQNMEAAMLVFLGGTCGNNNWREGLIRRMSKRGFPRKCFFDPVVPVWTEAVQRHEDALKRTADILFFYLGNPREPGRSSSDYSTQEAIMGQYDTNRTIVVFDLADLEGHARKAAAKGMRDLQGRFPYGPIFDSLPPAENWLARRLRSL